MLRYHCFSLGAALALSMLAAGARAEPPLQTADPVARARVFLDLAIDLVKKRRCPAALELLEAAAQLVDNADITYQRANCELQLGHYTRARKLSQLALRGLLEGTVNNSENASTRVGAERTLQELTETLGTLRLHVAPQGACVRIDGRALEPDMGRESTWLAGTAGPDMPCVIDDPSIEIFVDPGLHTVSISKPPWISQTFEITVPGHETRSRSVVLEQNHLQTAGIYTLIAGGGAVLAGTILGVLALDRQKKSEGQCFAFRCSQEGLSLHQQAQRLGDGASIVFGVAGAFSVVGTMFLISARRARPLEASVAITPTSSGVSSRLRVSF